MSGAGPNKRLVHQCRYMYETERASQQQQQQQLLIATSTWVVVYCHMYYEPARLTTSISQLFSTNYMNFPVGKSSRTSRNFITGLMERNNYMLNMREVTFNRQNDCSSKNPLTN